jgi:hypothetical protein
MPSKLQSETSRRNGSKSRGPVTAEGRLKSAAHLYSHGLYARSIVLEGESRDRFNALLVSLHDEFLPETPSEQLLVEKMAVAQWRQMRLWTYERAAIARESGKHANTPGVTTPAAADAVAYANLAPGALSQHEMRLSRQFDRCYDRLTRRKNKDRTQEIVDSNDQPTAREPETDPAIPQNPL